MDIRRAIRTVTGQRSRTNKRVRANIRTSELTRSTRNSAKAVAKFMRKSDGGALSPRNKVADLDWKALGTMVKHGTTKKKIRPTAEIMRRAVKLQRAAAKGQRAAKAMGVREGLIEAILATIT